jgi:alpha-mannosidase
VHITVELDWQEPEHLLKLHFPTAFAATNARFGSPFGSVLRPQVASDLASEAKWEVPFSRYLAVFDEGEATGLFLATEAKYGASVREGDIGLSLVRSPRVTGFEAHGGAWPAHLTRLKVSSPYSDLGRHVIRLAIGRYASELPRERQPAALADTLFTPPISYRGQRVAPVLESIEGGNSLVPAWVVPMTGDGASWLLRLHEVAGKRGTVTLRAAKGWSM